MRSVLRMFLSGPVARIGYWIVLGLSAAFAAAHPRPPRRPPHQRNGHPVTVTDRIAGHTAASPAVIAAAERLNVAADAYQTATETYAAAHLAVLAAVVRRWVPDAARARIDLPEHGVFRLLALATADGTVLDDGGYVRPGDPAFVAAAHDYLYGPGGFANVADALPVDRDGWVDLPPTRRSPT